MTDLLDRLYGVPLEEFVRERDAAARELRQGGDREAAALLAKLPKPTPAAWAANQVARERPDVLRGLLDAGAALRAAQEATIAGERAGLRDATRAQREAVEEFMAAANVLQPGGRPLSRAMSDRLRATLLAAAGNETLSDALAAGRLALEAEAGGAWPPPDVDAETAAPSQARTTTAGAAAKARGKSREAAEREESARAEREARRELERRLGEARGEVRVRQRALDVAEKDAARAARRLDEAVAAAEDARAEAEAMERLSEEAREALGSARDQAARLEERLD